jgi:hypothetical protein
MNRDRPISKEGANTWKRGWEVIDVVRGVVVANLSSIDLAVLAREITDLAGLGEFGVAGRCLKKSFVSNIQVYSAGVYSYLATDEWVKMA